MYHTKRKRLCECKQGSCRCYEDEIRADEASMMKYLSYLLEEEDRADEEADKKVTFNEKVRVREIEEEDEEIKED